MTIGVGILGFAHGHVGTYCTAWQRQPQLGVQISTGWDHDAARLASAVKSYGISPAGSAGELLDRPEVQAVAIGAETAMHAELVEQAAKAGKAIVLQKPVALTLQEADRIVAAVDTSSAPFTLAWQMREDPQNRQIKELIHSGQLGRICMVRRRHSLSTHTWAGFESTWHVNPALNRDIWADDASHPIDFLLWLLGEPVSVTAELASIVNPRIPNDNGIAIFRYADGCIAEVCCSFTSLAGENTTEVVGTEGVVIQNYGDAPSANCPRPGGGIGLKWYLKSTGQWTLSDIASPVNHGERISGLAGPLADFLHGRRGPIASAQDGRTALKMVLACYESSHTGRRVQLERTGQR